MESVMAMPGHNWSLARDLPSRASASPALEFGRFRVLLRQRHLVADGAPIELGTRAFDILLILLEAAGSLVTKDELLRRVWPGIAVVEGSIKVQICALRKALGEDHDFIRTEVGRGYRFTAAVRSTVAHGAGRCQTRRRHRPTQSRSCRLSYRHKRCANGGIPEAASSGGLLRSNAPCPARRSIPSRPNFTGSTS
jgi:DNA-binding winged helix-turn-helix (wHTH) protein